MSIAQGVQANVETSSNGEKKLIVFPEEMNIAPPETN